MLDMQVIDLYIFYISHFFSANDIFMELIFLLFKKICEIDSFYFTKFLAWTFYNLWHHCSVYLGGSIGGENFVPFAHVKLFS